MDSFLDRELPARLICFSHLRWHFVFQRPQHLMTRAAHHYAVKFIEEPLRNASGPHGLNVTEVAENLTVLTPLLPLGLSSEEEAARIRVMLDAELKGEPVKRTIAWYYSPMALAFSQHLNPDLCIYDCMDELSAFKDAPRALRVMESWLFSRAQLVFTGGYSLYEAKRNWHCDVHAFPSSIDKDHFANAVTGALPDPLDQQQIPNPRIGYFGVIDERMDLDLVERLAELRPNWQFVMLGPVVKIDPNTLPRRPNIHWLGGKSYADLPAYLAHWQAGIMPFAINEATHFISPTKTPEFLAAAVPVVSTPIRDVIRPYGERQLVEIGATPEEFAAALDKLLIRPKAPWLTAVKRQLATTSWDKTWAEMQSLMNAKLAGRRRKYGIPAAEQLSIGNSNV